MSALNGCPWCGGYADFDSDSDGTFYLDVRHVDDCPMAMATGERQTSLFFDPEEMQRTEPEAKALVADWWNRRK